MASDQSRPSAVGAEVDRRVGKKLALEMQRQTIEVGPLAALLGLSESELIDRMEGRVRLAPTHLVLLANTLDIPLSHFFSIDPSEDIPTTDD